MRKFLTAVSIVTLISGATSPAFARDHDNHERHQHYERHGHHDDALIGGLLVGGLVFGAIALANEHHEYHSHYYAAPVSYETQPVYYVVPRYVPNYVAPPVEPVTYVDEGSNQYCREYTRRVQIGGRMQESYGTACLQPDGAWRVMNESLN